MNIAELNYRQTKPLFLSLQSSLLLLIINPMAKQYSLIIVGGGPAGLAASIYASRYKIDHLIFAANPGGTIALAHKVENYPGFPSLSGAELAQKLIKHAKSLGGQINIQEVNKIEKENEAFTITTGQDEQYSAQTLILATGTQRRQLNIPGENKYLGKGVSYCATCDAAFYENKTAVVVGGANAACSSALYLADIAAKVYLVYRRDELRALPVWVEKAKKHPDIEIIYEANLKEIIGDESGVTGVKLDSEYQGKKTLAADGVFIEIGGIPQIKLAQSLGIELDEDNFIKTNKKMATNITGAFSAGDANSWQKHCQQAITAAAEGAMAAMSVYEYLQESR